MLNKRTFRLLIFLCALVVLLPVVVKAVQLKKQETSMFLSEHSLFEDVAFASYRTSSQHIKPMREDSDDENAYIAYIPSEFQKEVSVACRYIKEVWIDGKKYMPEDRLSGVEEGVRYSIALRAKGEDITETGWITFYFAENVPSLYINTDSGSMDAVNASADHSYMETATFMAIEENGTVSGSGRCTIKGRGNTTWAYDIAVKKPYNIETEAEVSLLGMGKQTKWSLLANCYDGSQLRCWLAYDLAQKLDLPSAVETEFANVYLNGQYNGLYLVTQHIDISGGNVDVFDLNQENKDYNRDFLPELVKGYDEKGRFVSYYTGTSPDNLTGGYLLEFVANTTGMLAYDVPWFQMDHNNVLVESPKYPTKEEVQYISAYMHTVEDSVFNTTDEGYHQYLDFDSWVNMYYMREFLHSWDGETNSSYIYKDRDSGILYNGPAWDYDLSMGQTWGEHTPFTTQCMWLESKTEFSWLQGLMTNHSDYAQAVETRYFDTFLPLITEEMETVLPNQYAYICKSAQMDYVRYPIEVRAQYPGDFQEEYDYLCWWLRKRTEFFTDYLQNSDDYVQVELRAGNTYICYTKPGTMVSEVPTVGGEVCKWYYDDNTQVKIGDVIQKATRITAEIQLQ